MTEPANYIVTVIDRMDDESREFFVAKPNVFINVFKVGDLNILPITDLNSNITFYFILEPGVKVYVVPIKKN